MIGGLGRAVVGSAAVRGAAIVVAVVSMPAYLRFFSSAPTLGVWFTVLTVIGWLLTLDLGAGNGMRNLVAKQLAEAHGSDLRATISSGYLFTFAIALALATAAALLVPSVPWNAFFNVPSDELSSGTLDLVMLISAGTICGQLVLRNVASLLYALQRPVASAALPLATSTGMLAVVLILPTTEPERDLVRLSIVYLMASCLPYILASLVVFAGPLRDARPGLAGASRESLRAVASLGGGFFMINLLFMALVTTDTPLITWLAGPAAVVDYQVYYRPFFLIASLFAIALTPIWSAVTRAWTQQRHQWVRTTYRRMLGLSVGGTLAALLVLVFLQPLVNLWLGSESIEVDRQVGSAFVALAGATMLNGAVSNIASGIGNIRHQIAGYGVGVAVKIPLALVLAPALGWVGVVWACAVALGIYCLIMMWWIRGAIDLAMREVQPERGSR